ncbi:Hypothetical predicted protein [Mytilus galloprovincialis]|uniref:Thioredoxin domain-containing protein n=2 Tax=Mytilus galloprovincialis TaxID=29158 RepID=A0A8B6EVQ9_MYTGA|nr:Hypothetical predicted protein [Mytilus galloprovincialis]
MRKLNLTVHRQIFQDTCLKASKLLLKSKKDYFSTKISEIEHDQKQLHCLTNDLMGNRREIILPSHNDEKVLADKFCEFFVRKISAIRDNLTAKNDASSYNRDTMRADIKFEGEPLRSLSPVSNDELRKIILAAPTKSCELDPLPTKLLKPCVNLIRDEGLYKSSDDVVILTNDSFYPAVLGSENAWIIEFYNSWCGHCINFAPKWKEFATNTKGWQKVISIGAVDCSQNDNIPLCRNYDIQGYPAIIFFPPHADEAYRGEAIHDQDTDSIGRRVINYIGQFVGDSKPQSWPALQPLSNTTDVETVDYMETNQKSAIEFRENKYIAKLPWKPDHEPLPTNFFVTKRRTENVIRKLSQDPEMLKVYGQIIKDQERRGFIEKVKDPDISKGIVHYIPHHPVKKK